MELKCGICLVRPWRESDAAAITPHANDRDVWLNLRDRFPHPYSEADAVAYVRTVAAQAPPTSFAIVVGGQAVGGISLRLGEDIERCSAEIGYWIGRAYWGRGIMTAAVRAVTRYAFTTLDLLRVFALPFTDNGASIRVLEKAGYAREGLLRSSAIKGGRVRDQYLYAMVREGGSEAGAGAALHRVLLVIATTALGLIGSGGAACVRSAAAQAPPAPITIRAGTLIDGRGGVKRDVLIIVEGRRILRLETSAARPATYDLSTRTVLPGLIDTHVHIGSHFGKDGRASTDGETPGEQALYAAENAYLTLMAGFTTVQSIGAPGDVALRDAIGRGHLPGPRLLTSIASLTDTALPPDQIRRWVRDMAGRGADLIKIFASKSIREGGAQTLSDAQIRAACEEAKAVGKRIWVHAHAASAARAAATAGCFAVTHGSQLTEREFALMAERGTYFEPNIGLVSQNYIENKARYLGIGNYNEAGFAFMERGIPLKLSMFREALRHPRLKLIMGTDATAGAHGQNAREIIYRVQVAGQPAMDALLGATSLAAEALGLADRIGTVAPGFEADLIAVDGNPLEDITALRRVVFVMKAGTVFK